MISIHLCVSQLCMVSLSLFQTLLSLNCEDVMLQLILRYACISDLNRIGYIHWFQSLWQYVSFLSILLCICVGGVLRYLLPCNHVMLSQRRSIRETDMYGKSADKFLSLIPECCRLNTMHSTEQEEDGAFWGRGE